LAKLIFSEKTLGVGGKKFQPAVAKFKGSTFCRGVTTFGIETSLQWFLTLELYRDLILSVGFGPLKEGGFNFPLEQRVMLIYRLGKKTTFSRGFCGVLGAHKSFLVLTQVKKPGLNWGVFFSLH